jgi:hypothetical protein
MPFASLVPSVAESFLFLGKYRIPRNPETRHHPDGDSGVRMWTMLTVAAVAASEATISVEYSTIVDKHISTIMPLFLSDELTFEWSRQLESIKQVQTRRHGELSLQQFKLPWPLASREVLLQCKTAADVRTGKFTSECRSVRDLVEEAPLRPDIVRLELRRTAWQLEALPRERTKLSLALEVPASAAAGLPAFVVRYCQKSSLRDSVTQLLDAVDRLALPPHKEYLQCQRSRAAGDATSAHHDISFDRGVAAILLGHPAVLSLLALHGVGIILVWVVRKGMRSRRFVKWHHHQDGHMRDEQQALHKD